MTDKKPKPPTPDEAPTHDAVFQAFKKKGLGIPWRVYWGEEWDKLLGLYEKKGWKCFPVQHHSKRPQSKWDSVTFDPNVLKFHVRGTHGGNIGVHAGESGLAIIDVDTRFLPEPFAKLIGSTPVISTPKGFAFFTESKEPLREGETMAFEKRWPCVESIRADAMYELVPFSETCKGDTGGVHEKAPYDHTHDWRIRIWIPEGSASLPVMPLSEFVGRVMS